MIHLDRDRLFSNHRATFGRMSQKQVDGLSAIADGMSTDPLLADIRHAAYMLATAWHETAYTLLPITERGPRSYFDRYDPVLADTAARRQRAREMGNTQEGDGYRYRGRGYVQLTWKSNYLHAGRVLNADLAGNPDLALQPGIAFRIMSSGMLEGWFTGKKLDDYIHAARVDYVNARRVINGLDRAKQIADYALRYEAILEGAATKPAQPAAATRIPVKTLPVVNDSAGIRALQRTLGVTADGVMGQQTYRAILALVEA